MRRKFIGLLVLLVACCGFDLQGATYKIRSISFDLNVSNSEGKSGMRYVLDVNFDGLKGKDVRVCAELLQRNDGRWENVPFSNKGSAAYSSGQGVWAQGVSKYLPYDGTLIEKYVIFFLMTSLFTLKERFNIKFGF